MSAYYNEFDPVAAAVLRELIKAGHIADGIVDERSIEDVTPDEIREFTQCHFFAGFGVWSYALRRAGWDDTRPVWTASCPCQPFSSAGAGAGFADPRHLWPSLAWLIRERRPAVVLGEQVASKAVEPWVDLVHADLEAMEYAFGAVPFPSAGVGAPHIRDRLYWVADSNSDGRQPRRQGLKALGHRSTTQSNSSLGRLGDADDARPQRRSNRASGERESVAVRSSPVGLADTDGRYASTKRQQCSGEQRQQPQDGGSRELGGVGDTCGQGLPEQRGRWIKPEGSTAASLLMPAGPVNGFWRDADWLGCRDDKWRPVEPGTFPLADGAAARVGRLRGYGNAINAEAARVFIEAVMGV